MEKQEHYKLAKYGKFVGSILFAVTAAGVTTTVHADATTPTSSATTQTSQSPVQQKATQNEQQLTQLASANAVKEQAAADSYAAANSANAQATDQQVAQIQSNYAQTKQQAANQIAAASDAMTAQINSQTTVVNDEAATATKAQQSANAASEAQMQAANSSAIAQAQQQASEAAAHSATAISQAKADYQVAVNNAQTTHGTAVKAANSTYQQNLDNENKTYQANQQQVQNTVTAAQNAVKTAQQAVKDNTKTETVTVPGQKRNIDHITNAVDTYHVGLTDLNSFYPRNQWQNNTYRNTMAGLWGGQTNGQYQGIMITNSQNVPTNVTEMPVDFQPGLIGYNPNLDHSEVVSKDGLTAQQKEIVNNFAVSWANGFRSWIYNNDRPVWNYANQFNNYKNEPLQQLRYTTVMQQQSKDISAAREKANVDNNTHTSEAGINDDDLTPVANVYKSADNIMQTTMGIMLAGTGIENLETMTPYLNANGQPTLLGYLVNAYNMTQAMWYGEIEGLSSVGGHAKSILKNDLNALAIGLQKVNNPTVDVATAKAFGQSASLNETANHAADYALTFNAYAFSFSSIDNNAKTIANANAKMYQLLGPDANAPEFLSAVSYAKNGNGSHTETKTVAPVQFTATLKNAQNDLATVSKTANQQLSTLKTQHKQHLQHLVAVKNEAIKQANETLDNAVEQATVVRNNKIAEAQGSQIQVDKLKQQLTQKYNQLVKTDRAKLAQIEADRQNKINKIKCNAKSSYDAKIKALGIDDVAIEAKINTIKRSHQEFVKVNADKLAMLKANDTKTYEALKTQLDAELSALIKQEQQKNNANSINTGTHTVVLPDASVKGLVTNQSLSKLKDKRNNNLSISREIEVNGNKSFSTTLPNTTSMQNKKTLPQTGNSFSVASLLLGSMLALFGLGLSKEKREY